jgi:hypothetical protein
MMLSFIHTSEKFCAAWQKKFGLLAKHANERK